MNPQYQKSILGGVSTVTEFIMIRVTWYGIGLAFGKEACLAWQASHQGEKKESRSVFSGAGSISRGPTYCVL